VLIEILPSTGVDTVAQTPFIQDVDVDIYLLWRIKQNKKTISGYL